jgi:outer membrane biosynthesis protein TonB
MTAIVLAQLVATGTDALAEDETGAAAEVPFTIGTSSGRLEIESYPLPPARTLPDGRRICVVRLEWSGAALSAHEVSCPEAVGPEVLFTVDQWRASGPSAAARVGELWFVYPTDRPNPPRVLVRQATDRALSLPAGVDAVPYAIQAWSFLRYPAEAHEPGLADVTCTVHVEADAKGYTTDVEVEGCLQPYRDAARSAVRAWRFAPLTVDGGDIGTALTLSTTFVSSDPHQADGYVPSDESARLWSAGQFDAMSRDDRIWFIRASLLGPDAPDLGPGQVRVTLPPTPDLGGREPPRFTNRRLHMTVVRPLPDHDPILRLGRRDHVEIEVYELSLPKTSAEGSCPVLVQVDGERQVFSWAEATCDDEVRDISLQTADAWLLRHAGAQDHSTRHRFQATFHYGAEGTRLVLPADVVRTDRASLPAGVHTFLDPRPIQRPPPRIPSGRAMPDAECELEVAVTDRGRPSEVTVADCPDEVAPLALRAVRKWRWAPAEDDGVPVASVTRVAIHFRP